MQREGAAATAAAELHPAARCCSNTLHHSPKPTSASGAHLQNVFTSSESGTVFAGAGTRFAAACAVTFFLLLLLSFLTSSALPLAPVFG